MTNSVWIRYRERPARDNDKYGGYERDARTSTSSHKHKTIPLKIHTTTPKTTKFTPHNSKFIINLKYEEQDKLFFCNLVALLHLVLEYKLKTEVK